MYYSTNVLFAAYCCRSQHNAAHCIAAAQCSTAPHDASICSVTLRIGALCRYLQHYAAHKSNLHLSAALRPQRCNLLHPAASAGDRPAHHRPGRGAHGNRAGLINWLPATGIARSGILRPISHRIDFMHPFVIRARRIAPDRIRAYATVDGRRRSLSVDIPKGTRLPHAFAADAFARSIGAVADNWPLGGIRLPALGFQAYR